MAVVFSMNLNHQRSPERIRTAFTKLKIAVHPDMAEASVRIVTMVIVFGALAVGLLAPTLRASPSTSLAVQSWRYDPAHGQLGNVLRGNVVLNLVNLSSKDITAYNISITVTYADGSTDYVDGRPNEPSEHLEEMLGPLINGELYGNSQHEQPYGVIAAGTTRTLMLPQAKDISDVKAVVDVVVYADSTAEVLNERAFTQIVSMRKNSMLPMQKVTEVIKRVLADPTVTKPNTVLIEELTQEIAEAKKQHNPENAAAQAMQLQNVVENLKNVSRMGVTEREYLKEYFEDTDKRIGLTAPHCEIQKLAWVSQ